MKINTHSVLNYYFSWRVVLSDDKTHYHLISRPSEHDIVLIPELGKYLYSYRESDKLAPERHPEYWMQMQQKGWEVIAEHCDPPALRGCNRLLNKSFVVHYQYPDSISNDCWIGIWENALHIASQGEKVWQ